MTTLQQNLEQFADAVAEECKALRTLLNNNDDDLGGLATIDKSNLVSAVNELKTRLDAVITINDATTNTGSTWSSHKINAEILAALNGVLNGAPSALDTLQELADALGNDADFAATMTDQLNRRVRWDVASQNLTESQQNNARINIGAVASNAVGNTNFDFVALFNQGLL
jgi:hypothetical protein